MTNALPLSRPLLLTGLMGAGKTTLGRALAATLGLPFYDSDVEIEREQGKAIRDIFAQSGEAHFRALELAKIGALLALRPPAIIASGGGAFVQPSTQALIRQQATSVWLRCPQEVMVRRLEGNTTRPLLGGDLKARIATLAAQRDPVYATADLVIDMPDEPLAASCARVLQRLKEHLS